MLFYTHILFGIVFFLFFKDIFPASNNTFFFLFVLLGSLLPDLDESRSKINHWSGIIGRMINFCTRHRGIFHSLFLALFLSLLLVFFWNPVYGQGLFLGYLSHLLGDAITLMGLRPLLPFSYFKVSGPLRVGGFFEHLFFLVLAVLIIMRLMW